MIKYAENIKGVRLKDMHRIDLKTTNHICVPFTLSAICHYTTKKIK